MYLLNSIDSPTKLKSLNMPKLRQVANELRSFILESVARTGGHLASNLGAVELSVALHYVFDMPTDRVVWDVGHQSYAHKILTGRRKDMAKVRKIGGISGFPSMDESPYDTFGAGHAGTSISAALGIALGLRGSGAHVVAVVGDGALSAGMAFEALNHAGTYKELPLTIVLNDNGMSISPAVGGLHRHLQQLSAEWKETQAKRSAAGPDGENDRNGREFSTSNKKKVTTLFEILGLEYVGPVDGHDLEQLMAVFAKAKKSKLPQVIHVVTQKGRGYRLAELDPTTYHGPGPFSIELGVPVTENKRRTFSQVFSDWICNVADGDERIVAITPAMREGSCLGEFERKFPDRYFDVGIAEQHAVTLAAGLAAAGMRPVVAIYSTFLQRGYDQLIHDVALQNLPVLFAIDRAGIAGGDGATHLGAFDLAALRCIPNLVIMTPSDEQECYQMLSTGIEYPGPSAVRYPRATGHADLLIRTTEMMPIGKGKICRTSNKCSRSRRVAILVFGPLLAVAMEVGERIDATVANMRFVKPLDEALLLEIAEDHDVLVTLEEATIIGGAGSACAERMAAEGIPVEMLRLGLPDVFIPHGDRLKLLDLHGLNAAGILESIRRFMDRGSEDMLATVEKF
ncbi:MAG TPA: 1-deoxy-D-xylulose-5-phosphate synthase [Herbaspirillum sp.]